LHCINRVFHLIPTHQKDLPKRNNLFDATVNIQAFVFNVFGTLDNLAWIWVTEREVTKADGALLPPAQIGLGKGYKLVREALGNDPKLSRGLGTVV
jgi:hypothetical protein